MKIKSVEGIEFEIEGLAEHLVQEDPERTKVSIVPISKDGKILNNTKCARVIYVVLSRKKEVILEERYDFPEEGSD